MEPATFFTDKIKAKFVEIYGDSSKPTITQFPELLVIFDAVNQINVSIERGKAVITDSKVTNFNQRDLNKLSQFAHSIFNVLELGKLKAYGFNTICLMDLEAGTNSSKLLSDSFLKLDKFTSSEGEIIGGGVRLIYKNASSVRNDLRIDPFFAEGSLDETETIRVNQNSNFDKQVLPDLSELQGCISDIYNALPVLIGKLI